MRKTMNSVGEELMLEETCIEESSLNKGEFLNPMRDFHA